jgi:hypothetical protein
LFTERAAGSRQGNTVPDESVSCSKLQDARVYLGWPEPGKGLDLSLGPSWHAWIQVVGGLLEAGEQTLKTSDDDALNDEPALRLRALEPSEFLFFHLP